MRKSLKALRLLISSAFQADPVRAVVIFVLQPVTWAGTAFAGYFLKLMTDGAIRRDEQLAVWGAVGIAATIAATYLFGTATAKINVRLQDQTGFFLDRRLMELSSGLPSVEHHERPEYLDQMELLREGRHQLAGSIGTIVYTLSEVGRSIAVAVLLASVHPLLLLLPLFALPPLVVETRGSRLFERLDEESAERIRLTRHLFSLMTTPGPGKELRVFRLGGELIQRHRALWMEVHRSRLSARLRVAIRSAAGWAIFAAGFSAAVAFVVYQAFQGEATAGDVLLAVVLAGQLNANVSGTISNIGSLYRQLTLAGRYLWLLDYADQAGTQNEQRRQPVLIPGAIRDDIRIEKLSFTYPGTDEQVLRDISLQIPAGTTVALVGDNGAGKTTLVKLLCRFYEPTAGRILLDGTDLRRFDLGEWRGRCAAGFQDFCRFEFLARETVGVGDLSAIEDDGAVLRALDRAGSAEIPSNLPHGLETQLGTTFGGVDLSGGQWQKLALGRAMMREAPLLLILDEPTANLDAPTEHALFERYARAAKAEGASGSITILVSHRFSTVKMADLIVVIDAGTIVEVGSHSELMEAEGLYAELFTLQAKAYR